MWRLLRQVVGPALLVILAAAVTSASTLDRHMRQLKERDPGLRAEAARAMGVGACCRPVRAVPPLLSALNDPEWKVREAAAEALGYFSTAADRIVPHLLGTVGDEQVEVRRAVVLSLGRLGADSEEARHVLRELADDSDAGIRTNLVIASTLLGNRDDSAIPILVQALGSRNDPAAEAAGTALKELANAAPDRIVSALAEAVKCSDGRMVTNALRVLQDLPDRRDSILREVCEAYEGADRTGRPLVLQAVAQMDEGGDHALPLCIKALADADPAVRREALAGAMRYESRLNEYTGPIIESLKQSEEENLLLAIEIVQRLDPKGVAAVPRLIALTRTASQAVRVAAVSALRIFTPPSKEILGALDEAMKDENEEVRIASGEALEAIKRHYPSGVIPVPERSGETGKGNAPRH